MCPTFSCNPHVERDFSSRRTDNVASPGQKNVYFGLPNPAQEQCDAIDLDICPDLLLAGIAAAAAAAFLAFYIAITMNANGRRRRKRSANSNVNHSESILRTVQYGRWE